MTERTGPWRGWRWVACLAVALAALGHASGLFVLRPLAELDLVIADARWRAGMPRTLDPRIVIVDIDAASLAQVGRWPWSRDRLAALTDELFERQHAAVVGFDLLFAEPDTSSGLPTLERLATHSAGLAQVLAAERDTLDLDARLARSLTHRPVVLGYYLTQPGEAAPTGVLPEPVFAASALAGRPVRFTHWAGYAANLPVLARVAPVAGFFNHVPDVDGRVRTVPLIAQYDGRYYEALALAIFRVYTGSPTVTPGLPALRGLSRDYGGVRSIVLSQGTHRQEVAVDGAALARVPYRGPGGAQGGSFEYVSAADLLARRLPLDHLRGKIVLVGTSAPGVYDQRATPVGEVYPGVEIHANLLSGLLDDRLPVTPDWSGGFDVVQLLLGAVVLGWGLPRLGAARSAQLALAWAGVLVAVNVGAQVAYGWGLPGAAALAQSLTLFVGLTVWSFAVEGRRRRSLARLFGTYVPPELVDEMARDPASYSMRAENRILTIMFCDMRNFTAVSELLSPEDPRSLINRFFSTMTGAIRTSRGTLDKYIGDAIMAFWGAPLADPQHATHAVQAALAMIDRLQGLNAELRARALPAIGLGIGLNTGQVCVGDMGSDVRRSYTVMGDAVNLASRVEGLTRHYGVDILVAESTRHAAGEPAAGSFGGSAWRWVEVDRVRVKGKRQSVTLFTPLATGARGEDAFEQEMRLWQLALTTYRLQHWTQAHEQLHTLLASCPDSPLAALYQQFLARTDHYRSTPPSPDWDGAHTFNSK